MRPTPCPRLFEVEAARDGRLAGAELANFERHMVGCPACLREANALEGLADALRASPGTDSDADMLHVRRERTRLLAAFDRTLVTPEHRSGARRRLLLSGAAALVVCVLVLWRVRPSAQPVHPAAIVQADSTAVWVQRRSGNREEIDLDRGALWIRVDHSSGEERLLVVLPDGELEDTGTTFTVSAEDGHTTRVAVEEGHVVLRIRGQPTVAMGPGDTWMPEPRPAARTSAPANPPANAAQAARFDAVDRDTSPLPPSVAPSPSNPSASASDPSVDFRAAMAALDVGDNHEAAATFANFLAKHPRDARAEDAAYLRIIALQRSGDSVGMKQAALEYLRRYPAGFRQAEVERLSQ
jgi:hypothetical protein